MTKSLANQDEWLPLRNQITNVGKDVGENQLFYIVVGKVTVKPQSPAFNNKISHISKRSEGKYNQASRRRKIKTTQMSNSVNKVK